MKLTLIFLAQLFLFFAVVTSIQASTPPDCDNPNTEINASCYPDNLQQAVDDAISHRLPLHMYAGTYNISTPLIVDYARNRGTGFLWISDGAIINGTSISDSAPAIQIICSGGTLTSEMGCFYFKMQGTLFVNVNKPGFAVSFGLPDFTDAHNSTKIDHLIINNGSGSSTAGGLQINYVLNSDIYTVSVSGGGGAGISLRQMQFSKLSGAASATTGTALLIEDGYTFSNTIQALDLEVAAVCMNISSKYSNRNTFISPYFNCKTPIRATAGTNNILINPIYGMAKAPSSSSMKGIKVIQ